MIIDPPIDKMIEKAGCKYALVKGIAKQARKISAEVDPKNLEGENKAISVASREYRDNDFEIIDKKA